MRQTTHSPTPVRMLPGSGAAGQKQIPNSLTPRRADDEDSIRLRLSRRYLHTCSGFLPSQFFYNPFTFQITSLP